MLFDKSYFCGGDPAGYDDYAGTYYDNPCFVPHFFTPRMVGKRVLVVGCAFGFQVRDLVNLGVDAYGLDVSAYAISQAPAEIRKRLTLGDACDLVGDFDIIFDEDLFTCLTDEQAIIYCINARKHGQLIHLITDSPHLKEHYTYHPLIEWRMLCDTAHLDRWVTRYTWEEV